MAAAIDVIIVSYRCEELLRECLLAVRDHPPARPIAVHVVDNASGDGTAEMVAREFPDVSLTANSAEPRLLRRQQHRDPAGDVPYVLALNPDTRVTDGALERLARCSTRARRSASAAPGSSSRTGASTTPRSGRFRRRSVPSATSPGSAGAAAAAARRVPRTELAPDVAGPVDAVNGAFMLIRRSALDQVGLFDEGYWMYMEDLDLCYRFEQRGWVVWYEPSATVIHVKAGTSGRHRTWRLNYAFHYGMYRFYRTHYAASAPLTERTAVYAGIAAKLVLSATRSAIARSVARLRKGDR